MISARTSALQVLTNNYNFALGPAIHGANYATHYPDTPNQHLKGKERVTEQIMELYSLNSWLFAENKKQKKEEFTPGRVVEDFHQDYPIYYAIVKATRYPILRFPTSNFRDGGEKWSRLAVRTGSFIEKSWQSLEDPSIRGLYDRLGQAIWEVCKTGVCSQGIGR